jgi:lysophospholipase L1-like esterase
MPFRNTPVIALAVLSTSFALAQNLPSFSLAGDWEVRVTVPGTDTQTVRVSPPAYLTVTAEKYDDVPMFNPKAGGWVRGAQLKGVKAQETTSPFLVDIASFVLRSGPEPGAPVFAKGTDYTIDPDWGTFGRLPNGRIQTGQAVYATYRHAQTRLDAIVLSPTGRIVLKQGEPRAAASIPPLPQPGERHLGNIYLPGLAAKLTHDNLFPILEHAYPEQILPLSPTIQRLTQRLNAGQPIRILAWGDSVTDGAYLPDKNTQRWQEQFVTRLRARFPKARIELLTEAWGGRNTGSYLAAPPGSPHNYRETVLGLKPDLIVSEFVNDAGLRPHQVEERYASLLTDFRSIGAEWIILTPHYVRPDWMNLTSQRDIDDDPRPYVAGLRQFAARYDVALADASLRYGRLWRQGIPYNALMLNAINHPDARGMRLFADALMALFP